MQKGYLKEHKLRQKDERPYAWFVARSGLTRHEATHRAEGPYACKTCGKRFASKKCFAAQEDQHTCKAPPVYETRLKGFAKKSNLNEQTATHIQGALCLETYKGCWDTTGLLSSLAT